jgi:hypothetical protein
MVEKTWLLAVAQNPFRSLKRIFDRDPSFRKLPILAQTRDLLPFRFVKNGFQKFFNVRSRDMGNSPSTFKVGNPWKTKK